MRDRLIRANQWAERHPRLLQGIGFTGIMLVSADYAGFIDLPVLVAIPAALSGILTGLRYALWDPWLKRELAARSSEAAPRPAPEAEAPALPGDR